MELDILDKKILLELEQNSKIPLTILSKAVRASREVVNYRINKLEELGIIKSYITRIYQPYFFLGAASILLKISRKKENSYNEIINYLENQPFVNWFAEISGDCDLAITVQYKTPEHLGEILNSISLTLGNELKEHNVLLYINEYKFSRSGILKLPKARKDIKELKFEYNKNINLNNEDKVILRELSTNSRIKNIELAKKTKLSEDTIRLRIKNLEKEGIIQGYTIVIDYSKLDIEAYHLYLHIENYTHENENKIKSYIKTNPAITYAVRCVGNYNLILGINVRNRQEFNKELIEFRKEFGELIKDYKIEMIIEEKKEIFLSTGYLY